MTFKAGRQDRISIRAADAGAPFCSVLPDCGDSIRRGIDTEGRPIAPAEVRIADPDGVGLAPDAEGEIQAQEPECFVGYADPTLNAGRAAQKLPEQLEVVDELPRTDSGKVHRAALKARYEGPG